MIRNLLLVILVIVGSIAVCNGQGNGYFSFTPYNQNDQIGQYEQYLKDNALQIVISIYSRLNEIRNQIARLEHIKQCIEQNIVFTLLNSGYFFSQGQLRANPYPSDPYSYWGVHTFKYKNQSPISQQLGIDLNQLLQQQSLQTQPREAQEPFSSQTFEQQESFLQDLMKNFQGLNSKDLYTQN